MPISRETVEYVAHLARIELQTKELDRLSEQLEHILSFIDKLKEVDVKEALPASHILPLKNVLREDIPKDSLPADKALMNAPGREGNFFVVPKVIE